MASEFGFQSFQSAVVERILRRECSSKIEKSRRRIERKDKQFYLRAPYSELADRFSQKRTESKLRTENVILALAEYLNANQAFKRNNYTKEEVEDYLLSFFERRGGLILQSVDEFRQHLSKNGEIDYYIGRFILEQYEKKTYLMDYLIELVKGYFVTTAIYLQANNTVITKASLKKVTFFLDTRILLGYLGYKSEQENNSIQEMVRSLKKSNAEIACFSYNEDEIESILGAYRYSNCGVFSPTLTTMQYLVDLQE